MQERERDRDRQEKDRLEKERMRNEGGGQKHEGGFKPEAQDGKNGERRMDDKQKDDKKDDTRKAFGHEGKDGQAAQGTEGTPGSKGTQFNKDESSTSRDGLQWSVQDAFSKDDSLRSLNIDYEVDGGRVTLKGQVPDAELKQRAESCIRGLKGVTDVNNQIQIKRQAA